MIKASELAKNISTSTPCIFFGNDAPLAYINNPKSACTYAQSILFWANHGYPYMNPLALHASRYAFWRLGSRYGTKDKSAVDKLDALRPKVFTFVRDPFDRFVSSFTSKVLSQTDRAFDEFRDNLTCRGGIDLSPTCDRKASAIRFARWLLGYKRKPYEIDEHFRPQVYNIFIDGNPSCTFYELDDVIKLEDRQSLARFHDRYSPAMEKSKSIYNKSDSHLVAETLHSPDLELLVKDIYSEDYRLLGYAT